MSDQSHTDQLERELEATLARLATDAVPDTARPPAPPWQERRRSADVRRFGRATPWLVAAVLLVIAGLGVGAAVGFDASAPDRAPVGTDRPSPTGTETVPDGTLGTPEPTTTPTSTPTLSRESNTAPSDGLGSFVVGVGSYGPVTVGMTQAQALTALGLTEQDVEVSEATCFHTIALPGDAAVYGTPLAFVDDATGTVALMNVSLTARDAAGLGVGTTLGELRAAYPDGAVTFSVSGWVFSRPGDGDVGTGYFLSTAPPGTTPDAPQPSDDDTVTGIVVGTRAYARGAEVYSEC